MIDISLNFVLQQSKKLPAFNADFTSAREDNDFNHAQKLLGFTRGSFDTLKVPVRKDVTLSYSLYVNSLALNYYKKLIPYKRDNLDMHWIDDLSLVQMSPMLDSYLDSGLVIGVVEAYHNKSNQRTIMGAFSFRIMNIRN